MEGVGEMVMVERMLEMVVVMVVMVVVMKMVAVMVVEMAVVVGDARRGVVGDGGCEWW